MKDISDAVELLTTARDTLLREILPTLSKDRRYIVLMIANAMAIALREQESGTRAARDEVGRLRILLADRGLDGPQDGGIQTEDELPVLRRTLCAAIRDSQFDDASQRSALIAHLASTAADWVAISNPKALRADHAAS